MNKLISIFIWLLFILSVTAHAVTTGADFLKLSVGARSSGMGEAYVAVCDDVTAAYWNPAGLAKVLRPQIHFMHSEAVTDASLNFVGAAYPLSHYGTFSLSAIFYTIKPIPVTGQSGTTLGDLNWSDTALILSYGNKIYDKLFFGVGGRIIKRMESDPIFGSSEGTAYAFDCGLIYDTLIKGLNLGASVVNTGTDIQMSGETKKDVLPQTIRAGFSYEHKMDKHLSLLIAHDFNKILDSSWYFGSGVELNYQNTIFFRTGYYQKEGNIEGITYGLGIKRKQFQIDYSNVPASEMVGYTRNNKFSISIQF